MLVTPMHRGVRWGMAVRTKDRMHAKNVMSDQSCVHINAIASVKHPKRRECQERVKIGGLGSSPYPSGVRWHASLRGVASWRHIRPSPAQAMAPQRTLWRRLPSLRCLVPEARQEHGSAGNQSGS